MINYMRYLKNLCIIIVLIFTGCIEYEIHTKILPDGSIERMVKVEGDSTYIFDSRFPIPKDSTWQIDLEKGEKDSANKNPLIYTAKKTFQDIEQLNQEFSLDDSSIIGISIHSSLEKRFWWFFTILKYQEIYRINNPISGIPLSTYVTDSEFELAWQMEKRDEEPEIKIDSIYAANLEERSETWYAMNIFEALYQPFILNVQRLNDNVLTKEYVELMKDSLFLVFEDKYAMELALEDVIEIFAEVFDPSIVENVIELNPQPFQILEEKVSFDNELIGGKLNVSISIPGLILDTNANSLIGSTGEWDDISDYLRYKDYSINIESRTVNKGITLFSGIIVLVTIIYVLVIKTRKRLV